MIMRLLHRKIGAISPDIAARVHGADAAELDEWGDRLLGAATLEEVFGRP